MQNNKQIIDVCSRGDRKTLDVIFYDEAKKKKKEIVQYAWYFYITMKDFFDNEDDLSLLKTRTLSVKYVKEDDTWMKFYCSWFDRDIILKQLKEMKIVYYEADLPLNRRYWIDSNLHVAKPEMFSILYVDIEVDDTISGLRIGQDKIISFAAVSNTGKEYLYLDDNEEILMTKIVKLLTRYDIIIGWNSMKYDIPFLKERCKKYKIYFPYINHIDLMQRMIHAYRFDTNIKSFSLDSIAYHFLKERKHKRTMKVIDMFRNDIETFKKYTMTDVFLLKKLNDNFKIIDMLLKQCYWCNATPRSLGETGSGLYTLLDSLILKVAHKRNQKGPTPLYSFDELNSMTKDQLSRLDYPGALVLEPKIGLYENVYIFDFKTLYPSIMITSNIGFDTLNNNGDLHNPSGANFDSEPQSILAEVLSDLLTKRKEYKEKKLELIERGLKHTPEYGAVEADEVIVKELGNSVYGICGAKWGRYFAKREIVESITLMGQWLLRSLEDFFSKKGFIILTGDTDSIIVSIKEKIELDSLLKEYHEYLKDRLLKDCNITKSQIQLNFDRYFTKFLLIAKKNYAGHLVNQEGRKVDYIHVRGLSSVKSDTCELVSTLVKKLLDMILKEDHDRQFYIDWIEDLHKNIFSNIEVKDISIHKKIRRNVNEYKSKPLSAEIASKYANKEGFLLENEIDYIVTGRNSSGKLTGVSLEDYTGEYDKEYYWDNLILPNITRLLNVVFPDIDWDFYTYFTREEQMLRRRKEKEQKKLKNTNQLTLF